VDLHVAVIPNSAPRRSGARLSMIAAAGPVLKPASLLVTELCHGAVDRDLTGSVAPFVCDSVRAPGIYGERSPWVNADARIVELPLVISAAPNWTICACADLLFPL
jgi:hypothetical protein